MHLNFFKDTSLYMISVSLLRITPILLLPFISRILSVTEIGVLELTLGYIILGCTLSTLSIEAGVGRFFYDQENIGTRSDVVTNGLLTVLCSSLIGLIMILIWSEPISSILLGNPDYKFTVILAGLTIVTGSIFNIITAVLRFLGEKSIFFVFSLVFSIVSTLSIFMLTLEIGMIGFLWGQLIGYFIANLVLLIYLIKIDLLHPRLNKTMVSTLLKYSIPIVPGVALVWMTLHGTRAISSFTLTAIELGTLSVAMRLASVVKLGEEGLKMIWSPYVFKNLSVIGHQEDFSYKFYLISTFVFCTGGILQLISFDFYDIVVPSEYISGHAIFCILVSVFCLSSIIQLLMIGPNIKKLTYMNSIIIGCGSFVSIIAVLLLIKPLGVFAVPTAMLLGSITLVTISWIITEKIYYIGYSFYRFLWPTTILAIANYVAVVFINAPYVRWGLATGILIGMMIWVYLVMLELNKLDNMP